MCLEQNKQISLQHITKEYTCTFSYYTSTHSAAYRKDERDLCVGERSQYINGKGSQKLN